MTSRIPAYCTNCVHLREITVRDPEVAGPEVVITDTEYETCDAFPRGIPTPILDGEANHTRGYPGDHGIRFKARDPRGVRP